MRHVDKTKGQLLEELAGLRQRIAELEAESKQRKERVSTILDTIPDLYIVIDREWNIIDINKSMAQRFGKNPEELIGTMVEIYFQSEYFRSATSTLKRYFGREINVVFGTRIGGCTLIVLYIPHYRKREK